jgi:hypothetical protein
MHLQNVATGYRAFSKINMWRLVARLNSAVR